tara:strand:- start:3855 stop:4517 length:663 start_codon:yes stop_codon:yes gene_type:complete
MTITLDASDLPATRTSLGANDASNLTAGTVATARLGSGTASSSTFLRGDQSWATAGGAYTKVSSGTITNSNLVVNNISKPIRIVFANTAGGTTGIGSVLFIRTSTDNGSSFESGSNTYSWSRNIMNLYNTTDNNTAINDTSIQFCYGGWTFIDISNAENASNVTMVSVASSTALLNNSAVSYYERIYGVRAANEANNAVQLTLGGGATGITGSFVVMALS